VLRYLATQVLRAVEHETSDAIGRCVHGLFHPDGDDPETPTPLTEERLEHAGRGSRRRT
jgi:hypothetical protein